MTKGTGTKYGTDFRDAMKDRLLRLDGAMGTQIQR